MPDFTYEDGGEREFRKMALNEMLDIAEYSLKTKKSGSEYQHYGVYGVPAAILLLSIADAIGSIIEGGGYDIKEHMKILNNPEYYNLGLSERQIRIITYNYRSDLVHQGIVGLRSVLGEGITKISLQAGDENGDVFSQTDDSLTLNLSAFLRISKKVVRKFINNIPPSKNSRPFVD